MVMIMGTDSKILMSLPSQIRVKKTAHQIAAPLTSLQVPQNTHRHLLLAGRVLYSGERDALSSVCISNC
jgi:hypothetical protein